MYKDKTITKTLIVEFVVIAFALVLLVIQLDSFFSVLIALLVLSTVICGLLYKIVNKIMIQTDKKL